MIFILLKLHCSIIKVVFGRENMLLIRRLLFVIMFLDDKKFSFFGNVLSPTKKCGYGALVEIWETILKGKICRKTTVISFHEKKRISSDVYPIIRFDDKATKVNIMLRFGTYSETNENNCDFKKSLFSFILFWPYNTFYPLQIRIHSSIGSD